MSSHTRWSQSTPFPLAAVFHPPAFLPVAFNPPHARHLPTSSKLRPRNAAIPARMSLHLSPHHVLLVRPRHTATVASAEEELFIRGNAKTRTEATPKPPPSPPPPSPPPPPAQEEQFDFVEQKPQSPDGTASDETSPSAKVPDELPPLSETQAAPSAAAAAAVAKPSQPTKPRPLRVAKLLPSPATRRMVDGLRRETKRLIVESHVASSLRLPSGREAITVAWEVALIVTLLVLLRAGVSSTLRWIHTRLNATRGLQSNIPYEESVFECMQRPLEFLSLFTVGTALAEVVSRPLAATGLLRHIRSLRELGIIISATWFLLRWIDRIRSRFAVDKRIDKPQLDATSRFAKVATFVVSMLISLDTIGINVQAVLAFGGIGGVAIGFAGREIISNFFGGFMIYVTRPFTVGEWIKCIEEQQLNGTVEDIGWYLTRIRTWDKRPLYIPNSRFSTLIVENGSRMDNRRIMHTVHLRFEDLPVVPTIVSEMEAFLLSHPALDTKQHRMVYLDGFDDYSVRIWFSCYTKSVFYYDFRRVQQEMLLKFHEIARSVGAKLATRNTRDVRPGADTDRYGPLGIYATYGQPNADGLVPDANRGQAAADVPGSPPYRKVRSPSDPVIIDRTNVVSARPAHSRASDAANGVNGEQSSTSAAAVAAAAAALVAARRNASRLEKEGVRATASTDGVTDAPASAAGAAVASNAGAAAAMGDTPMAPASPMASERAGAVPGTPPAAAQGAGISGGVGANGTAGPGTGEEEEAEAATNVAEMQISAAPRRTTGDESEPVTPTSVAQAQPSAPPTGTTPAPVSVAPPVPPAPSTSPAPPAPPAASGAPAPASQATPAAPAAPSTPAAPAAPASSPTQGGGGGEMQISAAPPRAAAAASGAPSGPGANAQASTDGAAGGADAKSGPAS